MVMEGEREESIGGSTMGMEISYIVNLVVIACLNLRRWTARSEEIKAQSYLGTSPSSV